MPANTLHSVVQVHFKLCMILTIGIQDRAFNKDFKEKCEKIHSQFTCCITCTLLLHVLLFTSGNPPTVRIQYEIVGG